MKRRRFAGFKTTVNADTGVEIAINGDGYKKTRRSIENLPDELKVPAKAALENFNTLIQNSVYVGSYTDYGNSQNMTAMHCFVAPFEYDGTEYRAIYSAKETRNNDGGYSTKLYLQRVEALKTQKNVANVEDLTISSNETERTKNYINDATNGSISPQGNAVNTIDAKTMEINFQPKECYNTYMDRTTLVGFFDDVETTEKYDVILTISQRTYPCSLFFSFSCYGLSGQQPPQIACKAIVFSKKT